MSFWGMSQTGKDAKGALEGFGGANRVQFEQSLQRMKDQGATADDIQAFQRKFLQERVGNSGFTDPSEIRRIGEDVSPGTDTAIANRGAILNEMGQRIQPQVNTQQGIIDSTADRTMNRNADTSGKIIGETDSLYSGARDRSGKSIGESMSSLDALNPQVEALNPASEAAQARAGRSFAPALAATQGRLRRSGVDPNSVQASSVIGNVEAQRARAMDDQAVEGTKSYLDAKHGLTSEKNALRDTGTQREIGLDLEGGGIKRGEQVRATGVANSIDTARSDKTLANNDAGYQDLQNNSRDKAGEELTSLGLKQDQFDKGLQLRQLDTAEQDQAAGQLGQLGAQTRGAALDYGQLARGFGGDAQAGYGQTLDRESQSAGWGKKLLGGIASTALNAAVGAATGGAGGGGGLASFASSLLKPKPKPTAEWIH